MVINGADNRPGHFNEGDRVQLTDNKGRHYSFNLMRGKEFHTHQGFLKHDEIIGLPEGSVLSINSTTGVIQKYLAFKPLLTDYVLSMPRSATIVYPKDAALIVGFADIFPGARVLEAGVGSGALTLSLLRAVGQNGLVHSVEKREEFASNAKSNIEHYFKGLPDNWKLTLGTLEEVPANELHGEYDRVILDMLTPWECIDQAAKVLVPGGVFMAYVATTTQLSNVAEGLKKDGRFTEPESFESIIRPWHHDGLAVRPEHRIIGHTGFLIYARRMAPGTEILQRRRRPSKGLYGIGEE